MQEDESLKDHFGQILFGQCQQKNPEMEIIYEEDELEEEKKEISINRNFSTL